MTTDFTSFLKNLTTQPGIYQMFNDQGDVIYVGKAKNLKKRVSSYFRRQEDSPKTKVMMQHVVNIEVTVTRSETEALLLEHNIIKQLKPKYNILLRDDKSYPYIYISTQEDYPRLDLYRGARKKQGKTFGPYPSVGAVRETLNLMQKLFRIRSCKDTFFKSRARPCLQYQIKRCTAPCVKYISKEEYQDDVRHAIMFLEGKNEQVIDELVKRMEQASQNQDYELAAHYRDQIANIRKVQERQFVSTAGGDVDIIAVAMQNGGVCVQLFSIRLGRLIGSKAYFPKVQATPEIEEVLEYFVTQYYLNPIRVELPDEVLLSHKLTNNNLVQEVLSKKKQKKVKLSSSVRGERAKWVAMAKQNAQQALMNHLSSKASIYRRMEALQKFLQLEALPQRMECFDISHSSGEATVASCVVFNSDGPLKSDYRRFNIEGITKGDDYAAMKQALTRRYTKIKSANGVLPDILFIDGGKGQLKQAEDVLEELQISGVTLVGVAKGEGRKPGLEKIIISGKTETHLPSDSMVLHLIQQVRDEAHRFAITGHRQRRDKRRHVSVLEDIEGVGAKRRQQLLKYFGGIQEVKKASVDDLARVSGISRALAQKIFNALH